MAQKPLGINPWITIWYKPRDTIRKIVNFNPKYQFLILSFFYGLPTLFHLAQNYSLAEQYDIAGIVIVALVLATFVGMLGITIASALLYWTGKWIGGNAKYIKVRTAVSWSNVPNIIAIVVWAIFIYFFGEQVFIESFNELDFTGPNFTLAAGGFFIQGVLAVWSFIILVKGLGQVNGFSTWKGVLNVLIPFFMIGILIWLVTWGVWVLTGMLPLAE